MWLRLSRIAGLTPNRVEEMIEGFEQRVDRSGLDQAPGYGGYLVGVDREHGKVTAISLWETLEDLEANDADADAARTERVERAEPAREPIVDRYEVVIERQSMAR